MELRKIKACELENFVNSEEFIKLKNIPISYHRAISQSRNPRASSNDEVLFVSYHEGEVVGYLGALPDRMYLESEMKIAWLTCFWVAPEFQKKGVAAQLFLSVVRSWDHKLLITNFIPPLEKIYLKTGIFKPFTESIGIRGYLRMNLAELLIVKHPFFKKIEPLLKISDVFSNALLDLRFYLKSPYKMQDHVRVENVSRIDSSIQAFIQQLNGNEYFKREADELNWILENPWIISTNLADSNTNRYYFSSISTQFQYQIIKFSLNRLSLCFGRRRAVRSGLGLGA